MRAYAVDTGASVQRCPRARDVHTVQTVRTWRAGVKPHLDYHIGLQCQDMIRSYDQRYVSHTKNINNCPSNVALLLSPTATVIWTYKSHLRFL